MSRRPLRYRLCMIGVTDVGQVRQHNEDAIAWNETAGLAVLADGMGGHRAGDVASEMLLAAVQDQLQLMLDETGVENAEHNAASRAALMRYVVDSANTAIHQAASAEPECHGMGSTLVLTLFFDDRLLVAHVGDSRLYRLRNGEFTALTRDHSLVRELVERELVSEDEARHSPYRNVLTRAVGVTERVQPEVQELTVAPGDVYLLCSDGLHGVVGEDEIGRQLGAPDCDWRTAGYRLIDLANERGGPDNISLIIVAVDC